jgi:ATP-dependent protease Clp ATPase subunit
VLVKTLKPSAIVRYLDQFVVGQEDAKKIVAVAVYAHYRKIERGMTDDVTRVKSNVLLIGSSGTGKTLLCETLSRDSVSHRRVLPVPEEPISRTLLLTRVTSSVMPRSILR